MTQDQILAFAILAGIGPARLGTAPARRDFGTRLIERNLARALGAWIRLAYEPTAVVCTIKAPLDELTAKSEYIIRPVPETPPTAS